ncbi:MAG: hypothetical protein RIT27_2468 [Pseudomonadota bacterium]|jgi:hypothetical protein
MNNTLLIESYTRSKHQLSMVLGINELRFSTSYWYNDVNLLELEQKLGIDYMEKVYFHIVAFEANKLTSLKPDVFDLGIFKKYHTPEFEELWCTVQRKVWAQWRYENHLPNNNPPRFLSQPVKNISTPVQIKENNPQILLFCGGGKDSLVSLKLLEKTNTPYSTCAYSSSIYGRAEVQHQLIGNLLKNAQSQTQHKISIYDDFLDSPVLELSPEYGVISLTAAETPSSIFASLPIVLQHRYRYISLGHEHSADFPNLIWEETGEEINHQWGKSTEAEQLLNTYIQKQFISNAQYFSLLKPIYDVVIFNMLREHLNDVPFTHSCNINKPWCKKCAKCAYVWLNYMAYLPIDLVNQIFEINLFDLPENQLWFRQMLGLEKHTPFECIGQIEETKLAFELCRRKGLTGKAMDIFIKEVKDFDLNVAANHYAIVDRNYPSLPQEIAHRVFSELDRVADVSKQYIFSLV